MLGNFKIDKKSKKTKSNKKTPRSRVSRPKIRGESGGAKIAEVRVREKSPGSRGEIYLLCIVFLSFRRMPRLDREFRFVSRGSSGGGTGGLLAASGTQGAEITVSRCSRAAFDAFMAGWFARFGVVSSSGANERIATKRALVVPRVAFAQS